MREKILIFIAKIDITFQIKRNIRDKSERCASGNL